jgi:hypothetical protein
VGGNVNVPEHLVDGDPKTAWNSRSGDRAAWIGFRVPDEAHVARVEIFAGFDATSGSGVDLFTGNQRVRRLRVLRDGIVLKEVAINPDQREFQSVAIDAPGGDFFLDVVELAPGTNPAWKEVVVSELRVIGTLPAASDIDAGTVTGEPPPVRVGSLDGVVFHEVADIPKWDSTYHLERTFTLAADGGANRQVTIVREESNSAERKDLVGYRLAIQQGVVWLLTSRIGQQAHHESGKDQAIFREAQLAGPWAFVHIVAGGTEYVSYDNKNSGDEHVCGGEFVDKLFDEVVACRTSRRQVFCRTAREDVEQFESGHVPALASWRANQRMVIDADGGVQMSAKR